MLGGVRVDGAEAVLDRVDEDDAGLLTGERGAHPIDVLGPSDLLADRGVDGVGECGRGGDQDTGRENIVLGLGDQVGGDVGGIGGLVGEDRDLGGSGLGVDTHDAAAEPLGGGDVDVAGAGDHVDGREIGAVGVAAAIGQQRDGLGAADGPHLLDPEQGRGGQDGRVG